MNDSVIGKKIKWIGPVQTVGPRFRRQYAIKPGDIAELIGLSGDQCLLELNDGSMFGWTSVEYIQEIEQ